MSYEDGNVDDMDGYDWVDFIDEYHCPDYWYNEVDLDEPVDDDDENIVVDDEQQET